MSLDGMAETSLKTSWRVRRVSGRTLKYRINNLSTRWNSFSRCEINYCSPSPVITKQELLECGFDIARELAERVGIEYFPDYCFCTIKWRGMKFRLCAHHGTGAAASPGGQRNAASKDMPWVGADLYWTGHLHQPIADVVYRADYDQSTDRMVSRSSIVIISPSYLRYFGGYGAAKRLGPGSLGITIAELQSNGNIAVTMHAKGTRL